MLCCALLCAALLQLVSLVAANTALMRDYQHGMIFGNTSLELRAQSLTGSLSSFFFVDGCLAKGTDGFTAPDAFFTSKCALYCMRCSALVFVAFSHVFFVGCSARRMIAGLNRLLAWLLAWLR